MAAPRNDEQRRSIFDAATALFSSQGFKSTTYSDIARACDVSKSVVQHYFPKKELFVAEFFSRQMNELLSCVSLSVEEDPLRTFCAMGLLHFDFLLNTKPLHRFFEDIVASRELTSVMVERERAWATSHLDSPDSEALADVITSALGGAYELIFQCWRTGRDLTPEYVERIAFMPLALSLGCSREQVDEMVSECMGMLSVRSALCAEGALLGDRPVGRANHG